MTDDITPYLPPDPDHHPGAIALRLMDHPEHEHLKDVRIEYLMAQAPIIKAQKQIIGAVHLPTVQGKLKNLFDMLLAAYFQGMPDFLMIIDAQWWDMASERDREALVWHELCHIKQDVDKNGDLAFDKDGNPKFALVEHDLAAFNSEVARYGAWSADIQQFIESAGNYRN
jgi:Putative phage metallopeptidase